MALSSTTAISGKVIPVALEKDFTLIERYVEYSTTTFSGFSEYDRII
jgi:hypothetical protein